jgi:hypothetical protein
MKPSLTLLFLIPLIHPIWGQEDVFKPRDSTSPSGQFYASVIPILPTDPLNGNPYRIAVRESKTGKVLGSTISEIEMTDPMSVRETTVIWTRTGNFVAFLMPSDRRTRVSRVFYVDSKHERATPVSIQDYFQNMLGRIDQVAPPEHYFENISPLEDDSLRIEVSAGSRDPQYSLLADAFIQLIGDPHSDPSGKITSIKIKQTEQTDALNSHAFGTFGTSPAEQALVPKASGSK